MGIIRKDKTNVLSECHCEICGYDWESIRDRPVACPKCHRYDWNGKT